MVVFRYSCFVLLLLSLASGQAARGERSSTEPRRIVELHADLLANSKTAEGSLIRHLGRNSQGKLVTETAHFRIVLDEKKELAARIAQSAEDARLLVQRKWFGDVSYEWSGKCVIYLHRTLNEYSKKTKQVKTRGHTNVYMSGLDTLRRSIHMPCDDPGLFDVVLPHEITHAVMAMRFKGRTPRWADEGLAGLSESAASVRDLRRFLFEAWRKDELFAVDVLMGTNEPEQINTAEFYAQSLSLVEFFVAEKGRRTFTTFLRDSLRSNYETALKKHYGIASFADLERRRRAFAFTSLEQERTPLIAFRASH